MAEAQFGLRIISFSNYRPTFLGDSTTAHAIKDADLSKINGDCFFSIRDWFEQHGWLLTRQTLRSAPFTGIEHHYLAPLEYLSIQTAFHATRVASLAAIMEGGLRPAAPYMLNFDRLDSIGNIYAATKLGNPGDHANDNFGTAHWWVELFAMDNRHNDPEWCIIQLDLSDIVDMICFKDIWSCTGVVLRPKSPIDPVRIKRM